MTYTQKYGGSTCTYVHVHCATNKCTYTDLLEHHCDRPGCGQVLVFDGNMKNNREVCYAVDAGYTEFGSLPGRIKTGCQNTPAFKSRYCSIHRPFAAVPQNIPAKTRQFSTLSGTMHLNMHSGILVSVYTYLEPGTP